MTNTAHHNQRLILWVVLFINASMFIIEISSGVIADSVSLQAGALDFFGDSISYAITLAVLGSAMHLRSKAAFFKGAAMVVFGIYVLSASVYRMFILGIPDVVIMGTIGTLALVANLTAAFLLFRFRDSDSNMRSVWLCSRNDVIGNIAVLLAAFLVAISSTNWADIGVASVIATLAIYTGFSVMRQARGELRDISRP